MISLSKLSQNIVLGASLGFAVGAQTEVTQAQFAQPREPIVEKKWRPGMALKLLPGASENSIKLEIAFDSLDKPEELPKSIGVRFYSYEVPIDNRPHRIGWESSRENATKPSVLVLNKTKYLYTIAEMDRTENGSVMITPEPDTLLKFRVRGAYSYFDQLFVLDEVVGWNEPFYLYEEAPTEDKNAP